MMAMLLFLLDTGVRSSELVSIHLDDVLLDLDQDRVRVLQGNGRKQRWSIPCCTRRWPAKIRMVCLSHSSQGDQPQSDHS